MLCLLDVVVIEVANSSLTDCNTNFELALDALFLVRSDNESVVSVNECRIGEIRSLTSRFRLNGSPIQQKRAEFLMIKELFVNGNGSCAIPVTAMGTLQTHAIKY
ncbi:hypothetical protein Zmor_002572 [Zophobas morio]|uniref:Uncharacterized protein n=1 Tax=Zophobas morio TaxID=2755281 RepID=A0AA38J1B7_9CUCU|nr:hypothetical protein Zmor_002572 [Zophobas morio]